MFIAYIVLETGRMVLKRVKDGDFTFKYKNFEYNVRKEKRYTKKFLGIKEFFFSMYQQGNSEPLYIDSTSDKFMVQQDVPLNDVAFILGKLRYGLFGEIHVLISAITLFGIVYLILEQQGLLA